MNHVNMLDCTLRDGAYLVDKTFGENTISGIISGLVNANIDFVEVGFFQDEGFGEGKTVFKNSQDVKRVIPSNKKNTLFTVLADYSRYSIDNLDECLEDSIDAIRECFFKEERYDAINVCRVIKDKGYKVFVQPVDILGYTDKELLELIELVNEIEPYCFSIVDTFGSMYQEDLHRIFELINHNLIRTCKIGFHSHNNMQLSNALSQEFIRMSTGKRSVVVDTTLSGMGRGAGNTPTELVIQYLMSRYGYNYDVDAILDLIDIYMDKIKTQCKWGYSTEYFVAGSYSAHVNNITHLMKKNSIRSKDLRHILNGIGMSARKRYDYDLLDRTYLEMLHADIDDSETLCKIKEQINCKSILVLLPGKSVAENIKDIQKYIIEKNPLVICVNFVMKEITADFIYMNNKKRYDYWKHTSAFKDTKKIMTSNFSIENFDENTFVVSFLKLIKKGWESSDNSAIMLLRLLDKLEVRDIAIAGFDGYDSKSRESKNYYDIELEISSPAEDAILINKEIEEMLRDFWQTKITRNMKITFVTKSRFEHSLDFKV